MLTPSERQWLLQNYSNSSTDSAVKTVFIIYFKRVILLLTTMFTSVCWTEHVCVMCACMQSFARNVMCFVLCCVCHIKEIVLCLFANTSNQATTSQEDRGYVNMSVSGNKQGEEPLLNGLLASQQCMLVAHTATPRHAVVCYIKDKDNSVFISSV